MSDEMIADLQRKLGAALQRIEDLEEWRDFHNGLDYGQQQTGAPHPNQSVSTAEYGGGKMRLDQCGVQVNAGDNSYNAITFIDEFQKTKTDIDAHYPRLAMSGNLNPATLPNFFNFEGWKSASRSVGIEYQLDGGLGMYMHADNGGGMWADLMLTLIAGSATIASGAITASKSHMQVDTQSAAASDDLDTINFGADSDSSRVTGSMLLLRAVNTAHTVVVKHNTGNIWLANATDYSIDDDKKAILLVYDGTLGLWCEVARTGGGGGGSSVKTPVMITPMSKNSISADIGGGGTWNSVAWPAANRAIFVPFTLDEAVTVVKGFWYNGLIVSGNVDVGIYNEAGAKQVSIGSTAQSGTDVLQEVNIADTALTAGRYYMALACDNTTAQFNRRGPTLGIAKGAGMAQQASAFALPSTAALAALADSYLPFFGFSLRTLVV